MSFRLQRAARSSEVNGVVQLYAPERTGARLMTVGTEDEKMAFGITFLTLPISSNGIAHILDRSVLAGTRKYAVKEPFVELTKGPLKTFLNSMTCADRTVYPVASTNLKAFYNLVDLDLDAVLHPLISRITLLQERWRSELASADATRCV
jgi:Zn-dependent M16 (insulinase) family peptidase